MTKQWLQKNISSYHSNIGDSSTYVHKFDYPNNQNLFYETAQVGSFDGTSNKQHTKIAFKEVILEDDKL